MGTVESLTRNPALTLWDGSVGEGTELVVRSPSGVIVDGTSLGASIAINGVCTTVVAFDDATFKVGLAPETLRRSNLGALTAGAPVNLERSLPADGRNSGHFVQGHVDCTGTIVSKDLEGESLWVKVAAPPELMKYVVPKGFIAVDGTSLTVCEVRSFAVRPPVPCFPCLRRRDPFSATPTDCLVCTGGSLCLHQVNAAEGWFTFMLVSFTQAKIVVPLKEVGDQVNLEADVFGKYVERSMVALTDRVDVLEAQVQQLLAAAAAAK